MIRIASLLDSYENVRLDVDVTSKKRVFEVASEIIENGTGIDKKTIFDALIARERLGSTGLSGLFAIPHARIAELTAPYLALIRTKDPVEFDGAENNLARFFFVMALPADATEDYLSILSQIASLIGEQTNRDALLGASGALGVCQLISNWEPV